MSTQEGIGSRIRDFVERFLALKITEEERLRYAGHSYNLFLDDVSGKKPLRVAATLAILFHLLLLLIVFPSFGDQVFDLSKNVVVLRNLARPSALSGGGEKPKAAPPKPKPTVPKPKPVMVPIPDPTPQAPEPIRKQEIDTPKIVAEISDDFNIGEIAAPPGRPGRGGAGQGGKGAGSGPLAGAGVAAGDGTGVYQMGSGVTDPRLIAKTTPSYTDEAIKAKVQGVVILRAIIRKNGQIDSFQVLRGLGYGLEERAIQEIATNWKFRPGTLNGRPVDVLATIEVQFNLR